MEIMNRVLFEVSHIGSLYGCFNIILAFCIDFFLYFRFREIARTDKRKQGRKLAGVITKVVIVFMVVYVIIFLKGYIDIVVQYRNGHYIEIEGVIEDYSSNLGNRRGKVESFTLDGVRFECSDGPTWGYCPNRMNGGVIRGNGQHLRIRYIPRGRENVIVYIEQLLPEEWNSH